MLHVTQSTLPGRSGARRDVHDMTWWAAHMVRVLTLFQADVMFTMSGAIMSGREHFDNMQHSVDGVSVSFMSNAKVEAVGRWKLLGGKQPHLGVAHERCRDAPMLCCILSEHH